MSKKWPLVVAGVVLAVVMLVAGQTLLSRNPSSPSSSASSTAAQGNLGPFPPMPATSLPPRTLSAPARSGEALTPLSDAPYATVSALKIGAMPDGAAYAIRMRPYGFGPASSSGSRVVIRIDSATPQRGTPQGGDLTGTNVIALVDTTHGGTVRVGGAYSATLTFRSDGKMLYPVLSEVGSAK